MAKNIRMNEQPSARFLIVCLKKKKQQQARASLPISAVLFVSLWALFHAAVFGISFGVDHMLTISTTPSEPGPSCSWLLGPEPDDLTDGEEDDAMAARYMSCSVLQAAAAALALLLAGHRRRIRRALACAALSVTVASHCMVASDVRQILVDDDPGHLLTIGAYASIFILAAGDLVGFLALLRGEEQGGPALVVRSAIAARLAGESMEMEATESSYY